MMYDLWMMMMVMMMMMVPGLPKMIDARGVGGMMVMTCMSDDVNVRWL